MTKKKKSVFRRMLPVIIPLAIAAALCIAIVITNIFIPIKYLTAYMVSADKNAQGELRITYLDVGLGDCALVELPDGKTMLIDGGDGAYPNQLSLIKTLNSRGVKDIDFLVCTSVKGEHCGGLAEVVKLKNVKKAFIPYSRNARITAEFFSFMNELDAKGVDYDYACKGAGYADDVNDCFFTFLSPNDWHSPLSDYARMNDDPTEENIDNASAVLWLEYKGKGFAFMSDIGADSLENIVKSYELGVLLGESFCTFAGREVKLENCSAVTVPAHGAAGRSAKLWYALLKPEIAVLSVGANNAGLPDGTSLAEICEYVQPMYTSEMGDITIKATDLGVAVS